MDKLPATSSLLQCFLKAMSQLRVAWGTPAPHVSNVRYSLPAHSAPTSFANPDNSSDSGSLPHGTVPSTLSIACGTRSHVVCDMHQPPALPLDCAPLGVLSLTPR